MRGRAHERERWRVHVLGKPCGLVLLGGLPAAIRSACVIMLYAVRVRPLVAVPARAFREPERQYDLRVLSSRIRAAAVR